MKTFHGDGEILRCVHSPYILRFGYTEESFQRPTGMQDFLLLPTLTTSMFLPRNFTIHCSITSSKIAALSVWLIYLLSLSTLSQSRWIRPTLPDNDVLVDRSRYGRSTTKMIHQLLVYPRSNDTKIILNHAELVIWEDSEQSTGTPAVNQSSASWKRMGLATKL